MPNGFRDRPACVCADGGYALEFGQTTKWDGDQLIVISAFWSANLQAKQLGLN